MCPVVCLSETPRPSGRGSLGRRFTPLHAAAQAGDRSRAERELAADGRLLEAADPSGSTPLLLAAGAGHRALTRLLLESGADLGRADDSGRSALHRAAESGCARTVRLLLDRGASVSVRDAAGLGPLGLARSEDCVRQLAAADAALSTADLARLKKLRCETVARALSTTAPAVASVPTALDSPRAVSWRRPCFCYGRRPSSPP